MTDSLEAKLKGILEVDALSEGFQFANVDSLARAEIIVTVEEELGVELTNAEILEMHTYADLLRIMQSKSQRVQA